jgi:tight adherence protein B
MGALIGLAFGLGVVLIVQSLRPPSRSGRDDTSRSTLTRRERMQETLAQAGLSSVTPTAIVASSVGLALVVMVVVYVISLSSVVAIAFGLLAGCTPTALVRRRQRQRRQELRDLWPDIVDNLASAVRAGMSLPEALTQLADRGPEALQAAFRRFGEDYRATGRFEACLDRLKARLADPVADRIVESLRVAREVGGSDLGRLLRTLSAFLREDARTRSELETRQGWTVNAARLAVAAPWVVLGMLATRPEAVDAYDSATGFVVLVIGGVVCFVAYRTMLRIGKLPEEERVLR